VPPGYDLPWSEIAGDVLTTIDALGLPAGEVLGIGHSMGGASLLLAEQARPGTFAGLWLFEPIAPPPGAMISGDGRNHMAEAALRRRSSFPSHAEALANYAAKPPFSVLRADALHAYVRHGFVAGEDGAVHLACRPEDEARVFQGAGGHDAFARLAEVACPVVVACGEETEGPALFAPAIADALPHGRLEVHRHMGHFGPLEAPGVLADAIRSFAAEL
jgi:pimeloyl-ACP methyl ester carboxylesterase